MSSLIKYIILFLILYGSAVYALFGWLEMMFNINHVSMFTSLICAFILMIANFLLVALNYNKKKGTA